MSDLVTHGGVPLVTRRSPPHAGARLATLLAAVLATIAGWIDRRRQRRALADLAERDDYLLVDIGRTREEALREASRPFWATEVGIFLMLGTPRPKRMWAVRRHDTDWLHLSM
jgi:uncharacterized protein YjiS (DUF1127 family)